MVIAVAIGVLVGYTSGAARVLIARRGRDQVLGGYWEFPGGKVEPGETARACVAREFEEELGLRVSVGGLVGVHEHVYEHGTVRLELFVCTGDGSEPEHRAVAEHRWVRPHELRDHTFPPANDGLIEQVIALLGD